MMLKNTAASKAIITTAASIIVGVAYGMYVNQVDFPPDMARLIPFVWLVSAAAGVYFASRSLRANASGAIYLVIALAVASSAFALLYSLGALIGD
jgi:hypothetical protein